MRVLAKAVGAYLLPAVLVLMVVAPAAAASAPPAGATNASSLSAIKIDNFGTVSPTYYRGSQPEGHDYTDLAALGVKTVIDLQADGDSTEPALVKKAGMTYVSIPMTTRIVPTLAQIKQFLAVVNNPASQPVYVHCKGGKHRTGVMTAVYRMLGDSWAPSQAWAEMKTYHFGFDFLHPEFKQFVATFSATTVAAALAGTATQVAAK